jgi:hypothetical protein
MEVTHIFAEAAAHMANRILLKIINVAAGIAAAIFWFMPLKTFTQMLLSIGCIGVVIVCTSVASNLDDSKNSGYWPTKPKP